MMSPQRAGGADEGTQHRKSTTDEIRQRFDAEVERFSNLETGQTASIDAPLSLDLVAEAAACVTPHARAVVDVGCGAGNYSLKLLERLPGLDVTLIDLSRAMLDRARQRVGEATPGRVVDVQGDIRDVVLPDESVDVVLAGAVLHHLRGDREWEQVLAKLYRILRPGGSIWIVDLIEQSDHRIQQIMRRRYGEYLSALKGGGAAGAAYRGRVLEYIEAEDTPRPLPWQLDQLRAAGFAHVDVLHKSGLFAAFGAVK